MFFGRTASAKLRSLAALRLLQGASDDEILGELRRVPGGARALRIAAARTVGEQGWPGSRVHELLLAAAEGRDAPNEGPSDSAAADDMRMLWRLDTAAGFEILAQRVPALRELERAASDPERAQPPPLGRRAPSDPEQLQRAYLLALIKRVTALVGPRARGTDNLTASVLAHQVAAKHLASLLGVPLGGA